MKSTRVNKLVKIGMLSAVAALLMYIDIPLWFAPAFYKIDLSEVAVLIGAFALGPLAGAAVEFVKIFIILIIKGTQTGFVGEAANFIIGCALVLPASIIYKRNRTRKGAVIGIAAGTLIMTVLGCFINAYILIPAYSAAFKMPMDAIVAMGTKVNSSIKSLSTLVIFAVAPFNIVKGVLVGLITFLLYKHVRTVLK